MDDEHEDDGSIVGVDLTPAYGVVRNRRLVSCETTYLGAKLEAPEVTPAEAARDETGVLDNALHARVREVGLAGIGEVEINTGIISEVAKPRDDATAPAPTPA